MEWYKSHGYHFVGLSDHNILQEGEFWTKIPKSPIRREVFDNYLRKYGEEWVIYKREGEDLSVQLKTLAEYRGLFEEEGEFLIIKAEEITDSYDKKPIHINASNIQSKIEPRGGKSLVDVMQNNIDAVWEQREATGKPILVHINHPNFGWAIEAKDLKKLKKERFFEVYNGHPAVNNYGNEERHGTEAMWDEVNLHYLSKDQPLMYGIATDDSHNYHSFGKDFSNTGRGWVMVRAEELTPESLIMAMERGDFYASTGVTLSNYSATNGNIKIEIEAEEGVEYQIQFIGAREGKRKIEVLQEVKGIEASYQLENERFVRAKITSTKLQENPFKEGDFESAWTQPVIKINP